MSEYDAWAPDYDAWAADMTEDFAHYVELAREADGPIVELIRDDGATIRLWWATRSEWEGLIDVAGLDVEALYGWFDRRPFDDASTEYVWVTRKPAHTTR